MFLDKHGIKLYLRDVFPINLCGVEDSVENYQIYLISWCTVMVLESSSFGFFLSHDFHAQLCLNSLILF